MQMKLNWKNAHIGSLINKLLLASKGVLLIAVAPRRLPRSMPFFA
jgi:hypothetical protein